MFMWKVKLLQSVLVLMSAADIVLVFGFNDFGNNNDSQVPSMQPTALNPVYEDIPTFSPSFIEETSNEPTAESSVQSSSPSSLSSTQVYSTTTPTVSPSLLSSSEPTISPSTLIPTSLPTEIPSSRPSMQTSIPSHNPSTSPSTLPPSSKPSCGPSSLPSIRPISKPSREPTSQPSSDPSTQPSFLPTSAPSNQPSSHPSSMPSEGPTSSPSSAPSFSPSASPSTAPTVLSTPIGLLGSQWWYQVVGTCSLTASTAFDEDRYQVDEAVQYTFRFLFTETMSDQQRDKVEVSAVQVLPNKHRRQMTSLLANGDETAEGTAVSRWSWIKVSPSSEKYKQGGSRKKQGATTVTYEVKAWCASKEVANKAYESLLRAQADPQSVLEPLHEHGIREVDGSSVFATRLSTTTSAPPSLFDSAQSPVRILWIIAGTLLIFGTGLLAIKHASIQYHNREETLRAMRVKCKELHSCGQFVCRSVHNAYLEVHHLCCASHRGGYDLGADNDEGDDFYYSSHGSGVHSSNNVEDGLHMSTFALRRGDYLEDEEEGSLGDRDSSHSSHNMHNSGVHNSNISHGVHGGTYAIPHSSHSGGVFHTGEEGRRGSINMGDIELFPLSSSHSTADEVVLASTHPHRDNLSAAIEGSHSNSNSYNSGSNGGAVSGYSVITHNLSRGSPTTLHEMPQFSPLRRGSAVLQL